MSFLARHRGLFVILLLQCAASLVFVFQRTVDADEGFYLAAAQRVADGMTPYIDFFYPQAPLFPYLFAPLSGAGIDSLIVLRILATLCGLGITIMVYSIARRTLNETGTALVAAFLVAFAGLSLTWHSTFKPYAFADLALMAAFFMLVLALQRGVRPWMIFAAMFYLSLAANLRAVLVVLIPVFLSFMLRRKSGESTTGRMLVAAFLGVTFPAIPAIYLLIQNPDAFFFNNLGFHLQREPIEPLTALLMHKLTVVGKFLALPQTILLLGATFAAWILMRQKYVERPVWYSAAAAVAATLFLVYLIPTPTHLQYFQQAWPYLALLTLPVASFILQSAKMQPILRSAGVLYAIGIIPFVMLFIVSPRDNDRRFEWPQLRAIVDKIQSHSQASDTLLSEWAGYAALADRPQLPGSEHVGFHFPLQIDAAQYRNYRLLTNSDIAAALNARRPELVVVDYKVYPEWEQALHDNYSRIDSSAQTFIYRRAHAEL